MQQGTSQSADARERISKTKRLQSEIARKALILKADPTNVEKQVALAEVLEEYELHKGTLTGAIEQVVKAGPSNMEQVAAFSKVMFRPSGEAGVTEVGAIVAKNLAKGGTVEEKLAGLVAKAQRRVITGGSE